MRFAGLWATFTLGAVLCAGPARGQETLVGFDLNMALLDASRAAVVRDGNRRIAAANALYDAGQFTEAEAGYRKFLTDCPGSPVAPEAAYRLACAYMLDGMADETGRAFQRVARDYPESSWGQLVLAAHTDEKGLSALANEKREQARAAGGAARAAEGVKLWHLYLRRFPKGAVTQGEALYKLAYCYGRAGKADAAREWFQRARDADKDGTWGKLADIRLAGAAGFKARMRDLLAIDWAGTENLVAFLDLSDECLPSLTGEDRAACLFGRARCLTDLERPSEANELFAVVLRESPKSALAPECAFWLAEAKFKEGDFTGARDAYLDLARKYPDSPRAATARDWAAWVGDLEPAWGEAQAALEKLIVQARGGRGALALHVSSAGTGPGNAFDVRLVFQDAKHLLLSATYGESTFLLANNKDGGWYRGGLAPLVRVRGGVAVPMPHLKVEPDLATNRLNIGFDFSTDKNRETAELEIPLSLAQFTVDRNRSKFHLCRERRTRPDGTPVAVLRLESARWEAADRGVIEAELDQAGALREAHISFRREGRLVTWKVGDLSLGAALPEEAFHVAVPPGPEVREVDEMNFMDVFMQLMQFGGRLLQDVQGQARK
jgi:TolA-binding protein